MKDLTVKVDGVGQFLTVREGKALELKEPVVININGDIDTVKSFVAKRYNSTDPDTLNNLQGIDKTKAIISFDKVGLTISLDVNPQDFYGPKVVGKLQISPELEPWKINEATTFSREKLITLIRFNRRYFTDTDTYEKVLKAYQSLNMSGTTNIKVETDLRGNKDAAFKKTIDSSNIPTTFFLTMPVFKGREKVKFMVEVCLENSETQVVFWFESVELKEIWDNTVDSIFDEQKGLFADFVIVNK